MLRWKSDTYGVISPAEFIPLLESSGWIIKVGKWVLEQAIRTCKKWTAYLPDFVMNVNVSYLQMLDSDFIPFIQKILKENDLKPKHIVIELTESYFVTDMEALKGIFQSLRLLGIKIAMDDFGTGYSNITYVLTIPFQVVKVDKSLIWQAMKDEKAAILIKKMIEAFNQIGLHILAEGIETKEQMEFMKKCGCDLLQGYIFLDQYHLMKL